MTVQYPAGEARFAGDFKAAEDVVKACGLDWTLLRCADFDANALAWVPQIRKGGVVRGAYGDAATSSIHERDIAAVAASALASPAHAGHAYVLTGPQSLTQRDKVRLIGEAVGRELSFQEISPQQVRHAMITQGLPEEIPTGCSAPWPTAPSSRDRPQTPCSRYSAAPHSPSPNGRPTTPTPSRTEQNP